MRSETTVSQSLFNFLSLALLLQGEGHYWSLVYFLCFTQILGLVLKKCVGHSYPPGLLSKYFWW